MPTCLQSSAVVALLLTTVAARAEIDPEALRPGFVASFRDAAGTEIVRLEPSVALNLAKGESAHPRLSADGSVRWTGYLNLLRAGEYQFSARVYGRLRVTVAGRVVFDCDQPNTPFAMLDGPVTKLDAGIVPFVAEFTRLPGPARVELLWHGTGFRQEPLTADASFHLPKDDPKELARDAQVEHGRFLAEDHGCTNCHKPAAADKVSLGLQTRMGPNLSKVGQRDYAGWIDRWLADPQKLRPGTAMPKLFADGESTERYAVTRYLVSLGGPVRPGRGPNDNDLKRSVVRGKELFHTVGCVACHQDKPPTALPNGSEPSFHGLPDQGGIRTNYALGAVGAKTAADALAAFLTNPLATNPSGRMPSLLLQGSEAIDIARYLCQNVDATIAHDLPDAPAMEAFRAAWSRSMDQPAGRPDDKAWVALGQKLFSTKGCLNCHAVESNQAQAAHFAPISMVTSHDDGCLADKSEGGGKSPRFAFNSGERADLKSFLKLGRTGSGSPAPTYTARIAIRRFNCLNCHQRDGEGGLSPDLVEVLRKYEKAENAESLVPPSITGVGHKLLTPWLKGLLTQGLRARPWMGLRMPQYGEANVGFLAQALAAIEGTEPDATPHAEPFATAKIEAGRRLTGKTGFGCISCHDFAGVANSGTRGPDLTIAANRLRYDWYRNWLEQPQRMQPGTRMPQVFTDGRSQITEVLAGDAERQSAAMWAYWTLGPGLALPDGLQAARGKNTLPLDVKDRPVLLRTFMPEAGARALAVGFPGGVSLAFDAATCRLAYAWSGNFLDASPVWENRGGAPAKLLGPRFWTGPTGHPWAVTESRSPPDFAAQAKNPAYGAGVPEGQVYAGPRKLHFDGYNLDRAGVPTFRYRTDADGGALSVQERCEPLTSPFAVGFRRSFQLDLPSKQTAWFLAGESTAAPKVTDADGMRVQATEEIDADGRLIVLSDHGRLVGFVATGGRWHLVPDGADGSGWKLLLRIDGPSSKTVQLRVWGLPREEPAFLKALMAQ